MLRVQSSLVGSGLVWSDWVWSVWVWSGRIWSTKPFYEGLNNLASQGRYIWFCLCLFLRVRYSPIRQGSVWPGLVPLGLVGPSQAHLSMKALAIWQVQIDLLAANWFVLGLFWSVLVKSSLVESSPVQSHLVGFAPVIYGCRSAGAHLLTKALTGNSR